jgi:uncharacterized membrane protein YphA (DoxX/SURF4 family)
MMFIPVVSFAIKNPELTTGIYHLGYPHYFIYILVVAKLLGVLAIIIDRFTTLKEWAYAGFTFMMISASLSHYASHDPTAHTVMPLVALAIFAGSYYYWKKISA